MKYQVRVASPCHADWNAMSGDARVRHCAECNLDVFNFSEMSEREIDRLVEQRKRERKGRLCARFYQRPDGTMLTKNCPTAFRASILRATKLTSAALATIIGFVPGFAKCAAAQTPTSPRQRTADSLVRIQGAPKGATIEVVDPTGAVIPNATVEVTNDRTKESIFGMTTPVGLFRTGEIEPGNYTVQVKARGFPAATDRVMLPAATPIRITLYVVVQGETVIVGTRTPEELGLELPAISRSLAPPPNTAMASVLLSVVDSRNQPLRDIKVQAINEATEYDWIGKTNEAGEYTFTQIPAGKYRIVFSGNGFKTYTREHVAIPSGKPIRAQLQLGMFYDFQ